jgi:hypothetical protein
LGEGVGVLGEEVRGFAIVGEAQGGVEGVERLR